MSDFARLEDKLEKLRQRERIAGEGRRLRGNSAEALLAAVVTEIDETILPRHLIFTVEGGPSVRLAVANRRLQALVSPAPEVPGIDMGALADHPLPDAEEPRVAQVKEVLLAVFAGAPPVAIQSARPKAPGFPSDVGVPSNILARAWGVSETADEILSPDEILSKFLSGLGDDALGWLRIEGENVTGTGGDPAIVEALGDQAAVFLDGYFAKFDALYSEPSDACATIVASMAEQGTAVVFVEIGELSAFIAAKADRVVGVAGTWQRLTLG